MFSTMALLWQIFFLHLIDIDFRIKQTTSGFSETDIYFFRKERKDAMWWWCWSNTLQDCSAGREMLMLDH